MSQKELIIDQGVAGQVALHQPLVDEFQDQFREDPGQEDGLVAALQNNEPEVEEVDLAGYQEPLVPTQKSASELVAAVSEEYWQRLIEYFVGWAPQQLRPAAPADDLVAGFLDLLQVQTKSIGHILVLLVQSLVVVHLQLWDGFANERVHDLILGEDSPHPFHVDLVELMPHNPRNHQLKSLGGLFVVFLESATPGVICIGQRGTFGFLFEDRLDVLEGAFGLADGVLAVYVVPVEGLVEYEHGDVADTAQIYEVFLGQWEPHSEQLPTNYVRLIRTYLQGGDTAVKEGNDEVRQHYVGRTSSFGDSRGRYHKLEVDPVESLQEQPNKQQCELNIVQPLHRKLVEFVDYEQLPPYGCLEFAELSVDVELGGGLSWLLPIDQEVLRFGDAPHQLHAAGEAESQRHVKQGGEGLVVAELGGRVSRVRQRKKQGLLELVEAEADQRHPKQEYPVAESEASDPQPHGIPHHPGAVVEFDLFVRVVHDVAVDGVGPPDQDQHLDYYEGNQHRQVRCAGLAVVFDGHGAGTSRNHQVRSQKGRGVVELEGDAWVGVAGGDDIGSQGEPTVEGAVAASQRYWHDGVVATGSLQQHIVEVCLGGSDSDVAGLDHIVAEALELDRIAKRRVTIKQLPLQWLEIYLGTELVVDYQIKVEFVHEGGGIDVLLSRDVELGFVGVGGQLVPFGAAQEAKYKQGCPERPEHWLVKLDELEQPTDAHMLSSIWQDCYSWSMLQPMFATREAQFWKVVADPVELLEHTSLMRVVPAGQVHCPFVATMPRGQGTQASLLVEGIALLLQF